MVREGGVASTFFNLLSNGKKIILLMVLLLLCGARLPNEFVMPMVKEPHPPYSWFDRCEQKITGAIVEVMDKVFNGLNIDLRYVYLPNSDKYFELMNGAGNSIFDGGVSSRKLLERKKLTEEALIKTSLSIFYLKGNPGLKNVPEDLSAARGLFVSMLNSHLDPEYDAADLVKKLTLKDESDAEKAFEQLERGEVDYVLINHYVGTSYAIYLENKETIASYKLDGGKTSSSFYLYVNADSPFIDGVHLIDQEIKRLNDSGKIAMIYQRNMQRYLNHPECH